MTLCKLQGGTYDHTIVPNGPEASLGIIREAVGSFPVLSSHLFVDARGGINVTYSSGRVNGYSGLAIYTGAPPGAEGLGLVTNGGRAVESGLGGTGFNTFGELKAAIARGLRQHERGTEDSADEDEEEPVEEEAPAPAPAPAVASGGAGGGSSSAVSTLSSLPAPSECVPRDSSAVDTAVKILRTYPDIIDILDLYDYKVNGIEQGLCVLNIWFKCCPTLCPAYMAFIKVSIVKTDETKSVDTDFGSNNFGTWAEFIDATRKAIVQVSKQTK